MIEIRSIQPEEVAAAKNLIYRVAHQVFHDSRPLEESIAYYESRRQLHDLDAIQEEYFDNDGIFLVMTVDGELIGTGAVRKIDQEVCELKRVWLLLSYHDRGLGYRMIQELLAFARIKGYGRIRLETDCEQQGRAYNLYRRMGFYEIPRYSDNQDDAAMEMVL